MARYYGKIGFADLSEKDGVWTENIIVRNYFGDMIRNSRRLQNSGQVNDNIVVSNELSIVADPYAVQNFHRIRYAEYMGTEWKVESVEVQYPRLRLTLGGVYNGQTA